MGAFCTKFQRASSSLTHSKLRTRSFIWHKNPSTKPTLLGVFFLCAYYSPRKSQAMHPPLVVVCADSLLHLAQKSLHKTRPLGCGIVCAYYSPCKSQAMHPPLVVVCADLLLHLAQKSLRKTHPLGYVFLCAYYSPRKSQAIYSLFFVGRFVVSRLRSRLFFRKNIVFSTLNFQFSILHCTFAGYIGIV